MSENDTQEVDEHSAEAPMVAMTPLNAANGVSSNIQLSQEEIEQESWAFLDRITEIVERLNLHQSLLAIGRVMAKAGMVYIHVVNKMHVLRNIEEQERNKSKEQAKKQK